MEATVEGDDVVLGGDARQRFHEARGYGHVRDDGSVVLAPVEAAHLLYRGDIEAVDGMDARAFVRAAPADRFGVRFLVYADLRSRGFYLSPARDAWLPEGVGVGEHEDLVVYPRGNGPGDGAVAHRIRVVGERETVPAADLGTGVLAIVDEEGEITYLQTRYPPLEGDGTPLEPPEGVPADLLADRVLVWDPPAELYRAGFYGQPMGGRDGDASDPLQLSLVEAAFLAARGTLAIDGGYDAVVEAGRAVEGDRFDRRLRTYAALRSRDLVPKTGFKFGADFRVYREVTDVDELGHSEWLVRVLPPDHTFTPRDLALDVRLAHGVRKRMVFALVPEDAEDAAGPTWVDVRRLTP